MSLKRLTAQILKLTAIFILTFVLQGCSTSSDNQPLLPFADFAWGASSAEVAGRHGYPEEKPEELMPDGLFWSYHRPLWNHDALFKYYFKFHRLTATYCFMDIPDISADKSTVLIRRVAAALEGQMPGALSEEVSRDVPFTNIEEQTFMTREFVFTLIDKYSYVCITGTWREHNDSLALNITMMQYNRANALIRDTEKRLQALMEADSIIEADADMGI